MKRYFFLLLGLVLSFSVAFAKDIKTLVVTTTPQMHCENCEKKIKNGLKFVKGVKDIQTNVEKQTVTIKYDADKVSADAIYAAFAKINYSAKEVKATCAGSCGTQKQGCCKKSGEQAQKAGCCKAEKADTTQKAGCCKSQGGCCKKAEKAEAKSTCGKSNGSCCK